MNEEIRTPQNMTDHEMDLINSHALLSGLFGGQYLSQRANHFSRRLRVLRHFVLDYSIVEEALFMMTQGTVYLAHRQSRAQMIHIADQICGYLRILETYERIHEDHLSRLEADPEGTAARITEIEREQELRARADRWIRESEENAD